MPAAKQRKRANSAAVALHSLISVVAFSCKMSMLAVTPVLKRGRKSATQWSEGHISEDGKRVKCRHCKTDMIRNATRFTKHLEHCIAFGKVISSPDKERAKRSSW